MVFKVAERYGSGVLPDGASGGEEKEITKKIYICMHYSTLIIVFN